MKTTIVDKSIFITGVLYSLVFIIPIFLNKNVLNSKIGIFFLSLGCLLILVSTWKYEYYKYNKTQIKKYNFLGLFVRKYMLNNMISYKNKHINLNSRHNLLAIIYFFKKNSRHYIEPNIIHVFFKNNAKLKIDERTMSKQDFIDLKKIIKHYKQKNN